MTPAQADRPRESGAIVVDAGGVSVGMVAFTLVGSDSAPTSVAVRDETAAKGIVARVRSETDLLIVSLHGGSELIPVADESVTAIAARLVGWSVDVVWGHGPHVAHPIEVSRAEG